MNPRNLALAAGTLAWLACAPAWAQTLQDDWYEVKNAKELRALYTNKTFRGEGWMGHYRGDGRGLMIRQGSAPEPRSWEVRGQDWVCATPPGGSAQCYTYKRNRAKPGKIMATSVSTGVSYIFTVEDGVPDF
jgi:hypothetical protein